MGIKQVPTPENKPGEDIIEPLFQLTLPAPQSGDINAPLPVGQHNACAQKNFKQVADVMLKLISNQKLISMAVTEQNKKIKTMQKNNKMLADNIRKLLKEDDNKPDEETN